MNKEGKENNSCSKERDEQIRTDSAPPDVSNGTCQKHHHYNQNQEDILKHLFTQTRIVYNYFSPLILLNALITADMSRLPYPIEDADAYICDVRPPRGRDILESLARSSA